jgi:hypothetical protein
VPVIIEFAQLRDIKLSYRAPGAEPFVASLDISTDQDQFTVLDGKGEVDELPLRLAGNLGPARADLVGERSCPGDIGHGADSEPSRRTGVGRHFRAAVQRPEPFCQER